MGPLKEIGEAKLLLEVLQEVEKLCLNRQIERRNRLIQHDQLRVERQRIGIANTLALPTTKSVGIAAHLFGTQANDEQELRNSLGSER
jgi:hypothetical protein